eukprot:gene9129-6416_t
MRDDDGPPPAKSARVRPRRAMPRGSSKAGLGDPRFDTLHGRADTRAFEHNYKFLREQQEEEEQRRRFRIRCLKCIIRRLELEDAGEDLEEYDLSDTEREVFGEDHLSELAALKRTPPQHIYKELQQLQRESQLYVSQSKDSGVKSRQKSVRKEIIKKEVGAVKAGAKSKPFFPKRSELKRAVLSDTFDRLESVGGKAAVDKYLLSKKKKNVEGKGIGGGECVLSIPLFHSPENPNTLASLVSVHPFIPVFRLLEMDYDAGEVSPRGRGFVAVLRSFVELVKETANPDTTHTEDLTDEQREKLATFESFDYHKAYPDMYMAYLREQRVPNVGGMNRFHTAHEVREKNNTLMRWLLHVAVAVAVSFVAAVVAYTVDNIESYRSETLSTIILAFKVPALGRVLGFVFWVTSSVLLVAIGTAVVVFIEPAAAGGGIPDVMAYLNGVHVRKAMNIRTFLVKIISCICAVASGLPVGLEAPLIHLGAITGAGVTQGRSSTLGIHTKFFEAFRNHRDRRAFITVGAACGVSAAFGAPIGGLLFVMEEISSFWDHSASGQIFLASMITVTVTHMINSLVEEGQLLGWVSRTASVLFEVNMSIPFNLISIIPALCLGAILGAFAALFTKLNIILIKWRREVIRPLLYARLLEPILVVAVYATMTYFFSWASDCRSLKPIEDTVINGVEIHKWGTEPKSRLFTDTCANNTDTYSPFGTLNMATGKNAIRHLFSRQTAGEFPVYYLFLYFLLYTGFACVASGMAISGGLVVPSLVIGAVFGRLFGLVLWYIFSENVDIPHGYLSEDAWMDPGLFALIGAAAFLAGTSRLGMSVCVIMVELSSELRYLLPIMVAIVMSKAVANWLCEPLYHHILHLDCVPFLSNHIPSAEFEQLTAADVMVPQVFTLRMVEETTRVWTALETTHHAFPIVEEIVPDPASSCTEGKSKFVGLVTREDLKVFLTLPHLLASGQSQNDISGTAARANDGLIQMTYAQWIHHKYNSFFGLGDLAVQPPNFTLGSPDVATEGGNFDRAPDPLALLPDTVDLSIIVNRSPWVIPPFFNLQMAYETFSMMGLRHMVVVDGDAVCGIITRKDLLPDSLRRRLKELRRRIEESGVSVAALSSRSQRSAGDGSGSLSARVRSAPQSPFSSEGGPVTRAATAPLIVESRDEEPRALSQGPLSPEQLDELLGFQGSPEEPGRGDSANRHPTFTILIIFFYIFFFENYWNPMGKWHLCPPPPHHTHCFPQPNVSLTPIYSLCLLFVFFPFNRRS